MPTLATFYIYSIVGILGLCIGSFLNVCIYRIPKGEGVVVGSSHCMSCGKNLKWYELIPIFSYILLRGRCSKCNTRISLQYPLIEAVNGVLYMIIFCHFGFTLNTLTAMFLTSALLALSIIDARTKEIPLLFTIFIGVLGVINLILNYENWLNYLLGFIVITAFLMLIVIVSGGSALGGGDVKLMAGCGLYLGLPLVLFAFFFACIIGSVIHIVRMRFFGASRELAMGPYLFVAVFVALLWGNDIINWYLGLFIV